MQPLKVAISIPSEGMTGPEAYDNRLVMAFHLGKLEGEWKRQKRSPFYEFYWYSTGRLFTPLAREKLVDEALNAGMDYILMIDDDMLTPLDFVEKMLLDVEQNPQIDVLAPLAFMRNAPHWAVIHVTREGYNAQEHKPYYINEPYKNYPKDTLVECDAVGFGSALINMRIVKKMKRPYFMSTTGSGEDIYFCNQAKKAGARIFMDTRIKLGHVTNPVIVDEEYYEKFLKEHDIEVPETPHKYLEAAR